MEWENDPAAVGVFHLDVAALAVDFNETKPLKRGMHLAAGEHREFHSERATTSRRSLATTSFGEGSRNKAIASRMLVSASSRVRPCDQQLFSEGQWATK